MAPSTEAIPEAHLPAYTAVHPNPTHTQLEPKTPPEPCCKLWTLAPDNRCYQLDIVANATATKLAPVSREHLPASKLNSTIPLSPSGLDSLSTRPPATPPRLVCRCAFNRLLTLNALSPASVVAGSLFHLLLLPGHYDHLAT